MPRNKTRPSQRDRRRTPASQSVPKSLKHRKKGTNPSEKRTGSDANRELRREGSLVTPAKNSKRGPSSRQRTGSLPSRSGLTPAPAATSKPGALRAAARELFADVMVARNLPVPTGFGAHIEAQDQARLLYDDFIRRASRSVRSSMTKPGLDLDTLMEVIRDGGIAGSSATDPRDSGQGDGCMRHCRFIGAATTEKCAREPHSIVSICSPDARQSGDCRFTLCFDAAELGEQIRAFRLSGRKRMPNPALADGTLNPEVLQRELDEDTVDNLEWQVRLAEARGALGAASVSAADHYVLTGVVLPAMMRYMKSYRPVEAGVRLYKRFTPAMIQNALARTGNAVLHLLDNPWLSSLALIVTKTIRTLSCFVAFGIRKEDQQQLYDSIMAVADPGRSRPIMAALVTIVIRALACVHNIMSLNFGECIGSVIHTVAISIPMWVVSFAKSVVMDVLRGLGGPMKMIVDSLDSWHTTLTTSNVFGIGSLLTQVTSVFSGETSVNDAIHKMWTDVKRDHSISGLVTGLGDDFKRFYDNSAFTVTSGIMLFISRRIGADVAMRWLDTLQLLVPIVKPVRDLVEVAVRSIEAHSPGIRVSLHRVIFFVLESSAMMENLRVVRELIQNLVVVMECAGAFLLNKLMSMAGIAIPFASDYHCCSSGLLSLLKTHEKTIAAIDADKIVARASARTEGAKPKVNKGWFRR